MAAQAEEPPLATPAAPAPDPTQDQDEEDKDDGSRDTKRRRTCVASLESLETTDKRRDCSFSFHARTTLAPIDTTPKFGSFNPLLLLHTPTTTDQVPEEDSPLKENEEDTITVLPVAVAVAEEGKGKAEEDASDTSESKNDECSKTQTQTQTQTQ